MGSLNTHAKIILPDFFEDILAKHDIEPGYFLIVFMIIFALILLIIFSYDIIFSVVTCLYPMLASIRIIEKSYRSSISYKYNTKAYN